MNNSPITARAHTNIALIKYWGKKDVDLIIPQNSSLSLTLDHFYTDTTVKFDEGLAQDVFTLNGEPAENPKVNHFMDLVRELAGIQTFARIDSINHVPSAAGLASSASAFAALAAAASKAAGLDLSRKALSRLARRGSGSASRSIYGGFVEWRQGKDDQTSYAVPVEEHLDWPIGMLVGIVNSGQKKISSRAGMQTVVETSPYYQGWIQSTTEDLKSIKKAIQNRDFQKVGEITESNALKMHALNLSAQPHFNYFEPMSLAIMQEVERIREEEHIPCYYTLDAGPNVKILCMQADAPAIQRILASKFDQIAFEFAKPGEGVRFIKA